MNRRALVQEHLELAKRHVEQGRDHVARQAELAAKLQRDGHDAGDAQRLLRQFEDMLALHIADRDRLQAELADLP